MTAKQLGLDLLLLAALGLLALAGCADPWEDPDALPYRFVQERRLAFSFVPADLDRDGRDEILNYGTLHEPGVGSLLIQTLSGRDIAQVNVDATVLPPAALDLDGDDPLEILLPFVRNDSLFGLVLDHEGRTLMTRFLTSGAPRLTPEGLLPWMPMNLWFAMEDVDGDQKRELAMAIQTGFARAPRGVVVYRWPEGEPVGEALVGASFGVRGGTDYNGDGVRDLAFDAFPSDNGADAGGLDDRHNYAGVFDLTPDPTLRWYEALGGLRTVAELREAILDEQPSAGACGKGLVLHVKRGTPSCA